MESVFILIPISIILAFIIAYFFWWSGKSGQFDDLEGPAHRILMDDDSTDRTPSQEKDTADEFKK
ncbi:cbb3-type cytochrome oxidase assembly protein CcoS [Neisseria weaveri]|uniref:Putative nitrogen fixation protein FixS n=1 Tax=Neisseria weaveri TaxID=28091 RepID=A0A448VQJ6_9NEIS|nr:cbb3-type cytochrome oxidase assembly protein CcoS [Neisseria weaveri]EGV34706.1 cytochrome oxidase maturation protein, Cbb3-type [Neisseria weaveri ATCC 51223]EGV35792.1 cytochrome oxidase maturation protein, Cbb3-type [Neisseria weaveri LMG 5135]SAY50637.1 putative nitrogen fixation protein FixS [Neisseria weaveri]VEJ52049.1 putative nitrogen fixation protein FixS [Neisseria weaveri]